MAGQSGKAPVLDERAMEAAKALGYEGPETARENELDIWPENWDAVRVALAMNTQLRISPAGQIVGYDYTALPAVEERLGLKPSEETFYNFQVIEAEVLAVNKAR